VTGEFTLRPITALLLVIITLSPATGFSQTRKRTTTKASSRTNVTKKTAEVQLQGATRVADQIKILTKFIYLLGGVAKGIESVDEAVRRNQASPAILEQTQRNKTVVRNSIQSLREALDKLEIDFRSTPELERYYIKLAGVADGAATAEQQAAANQFDQAGRTLLGVVNRLTDVLLLMR
jgi:hypothetical protein